MPPSQSSALPFARPIGNLRAFEEILDQLDAAIAAGQLKPGDRLPPEREFAEQFAVSRTSVREAIRVLEALGVVKVRRGPDNGISILSEPSNGLSRLLRLQVGLNLISVDDLVEFRILVESWAAGRFASAPASSLTDALDSALELMANASQDEWDALDAAFHVTVVQGAGNQIATLVTEAIREAIRQAMQNAISSVRKWPALRDQLLDEHRAIAEAIKAGEADRATSLIGAHIERFWEKHRTGAR